MNYPSDLKLDKIYSGDALQVLKTFPDEFVDLIMTSPPYWGLRDYGVDGQLGLEPTLEEYIEKLLLITAELKRVLKPTGVMFWNHGDCYGGGGTGGHPDNKYKQAKGMKNIGGTPKCLALQNYRLILKMIDDQGWILRNQIPWWKPNAMPSSVKDRFANAWEPVFYLCKSKKVWFDLDAVREPSQSFEPFNIRERGGKPVAFMASPQETTKIPKEKAESFGSPRARHHRNQDARGNNEGGPGSFAVFKSDNPCFTNPAGKNPGDVWKIPTQPCPDAHFAVFPEMLCEKPIKAGLPSEICKKCGKARVRITEKQPASLEWKKHCGSDPKGEYHGGGKDDGKTRTPREIKQDILRNLGSKKTIGWTDCGCNAGWRGGVSLDPFCGIATVWKGQKRWKPKCHFIGIEINPEYKKMAYKGLKQEVLPL